MDTFSPGYLVLLIIFVVLIAVPVSVSLFMNKPEVNKDNQQKNDHEALPFLSDNAGPEIDFYVIAHRGAKAYYPENTMPAFEAALRMGANMIELDVQLSKDRVPVVIHDKSVNRTTNGKGKVNALTVDQLKNLDAGSWFSRKFEGVRIPTLEEVLAWSKGRVALNIELKPLPKQSALHNGLEEKCLELVKEYQMEDEVLFSSFSYEAISHLNQLNPEIPIAIVYNWKLSGKLMPSELVERYSTDAFHCSKDYLKDSWIKDLKSQNIPFLVYTVNRKKTMRNLYRKGAKGIFTNKPDVLKDVIDQMKIP